MKGNDGLAEGGRSRKSEEWLNVGIEHGEQSS